MTLKGTWTIYFAADPARAERVEIEEYAGTHPDPPDNSGDPLMMIGDHSSAITFEYKNGMVRIFPWASVREARWEPAE